MEAGGQSLGGAVAEQNGTTGWTADQIEEAIRRGQRSATTNHISPANGATRYVHPTTGRSVVLDDATGEVIHVGGDGFVY